MINWRSRVNGKWFVLIPVINWRSRVNPLMTGVNSSIYEPWDEPASLDNHDSKPPQVIWWNLPTNGSLELHESWVFLCVVGSLPQPYIVAKVSVISSRYPNSCVHFISPRPFFCLGFSWLWCFGIKSQEDLKYLHIPVTCFIYPQIHVDFPTIFPLMFWW